MIRHCVSACHLINRMPSSVLGGKNPFSCVHPYKNVFSMTPRVFDCTCFVQNLFPGLDKLSIRSIKFVFIRYSRTQKGYRCYNPSTKKYFVSTDITFLESVSYFSPPAPDIASVYVPLPLSVPLSAPASPDSSPVPPKDTSEPNASTPVRLPVKDFEIVYTHRQKILAFESVPIHPSMVDGPPI